MTARIVVLASGSGSLLQALLDEVASHPAPDFIICAVICDSPDAHALIRAQSQGVPTAVVAPAEFAGRDEWNTGVADTIAAFEPDWIVCAGFMRILGDATVQRFAGRIINSHPALLPSFAGAHGVRDALAYGVKITGCTIHLVDAGVDTGPIIVQQAVQVETDDDEDSLHERIKIVERQLLLDIVRDLSRYGCTVTGRRVTIP